MANMLVGISIGIANLAFWWGLTHWLDADDRWKWFRKEVPSNDR